MTALDFALLVVAVLAVLGIYGWRRRRAIERERERDRDRPLAVGPGPAEEPPLERRIELPDEVAEPPPDADHDLPGEPPPAPEPVQFTVYHPQALVPDRWATLLAYVHLAGALDEVERDRERALAGEPGPRWRRSEDAVVPIRRESLIRVVPELPGCRFNPPEASVLWLEDWHRASFKVQANQALPGFEPGGMVTGRVAFYVESVLVGEVPIWALLGDGGAAVEEAPRRSDPVAAFERVFASYSHRDAEIVEALGRAYQALGMEWLRDVQVLRSGEEWNSRLLELVEGADLFQLYWSEEAARSPYVAQEWRHALAQGRQRFIRPCYWRRPMPPPPAELSKLHFAFLPGYDQGP